MLADFTPDVELVPISEIDERMPDLDDWEVLRDGLVTTDSGMVRTPESLPCSSRRKLTLVVAMESGHDTLKATGCSSRTCPAFSDEPTQRSPSFGSSRLRIVGTWTLGRNYGVAEHGNQEV